jgi:ketosteroid isomerase-like protein
MNDLNAAVREFFDGYEKANADFDIQRIAACYADVFMFGGPGGVQAIKKEDFLRVLPRRKEFFRSVGLISSKIESLEVSNLDPKYVLAKVAWQMRFRRNTTESIDTQNAATYVLSAKDDRFEIVFQIDHQDLAKKAQELGLSH